MRRYHRKSPEMIERFLRRLQGTNGDIKLAAVSLDLTAGTIRLWRKRDKEFNDRVKAIKQSVRESQAA